MPLECAGSRWKADPVYLSGPGYPIGKKNLKIFICHGNGHGGFLSLIIFRVTICIPHHHQTAPWPKLFRSVCQAYCQVSTYRTSVSPDEWVIFNIFSGNARESPLFQRKHRTRVLPQSRLPNMSSNK